MSRFLFTVGLLTMLSVFTANAQEFEPDIIKTSLGDLKITFIL